MASIKLGNKTLGSIAFGGVKIGDTRTLLKNPIFRTQALKNHGNKQITYSNNVVVGGPSPENTSQWLLSSGVWQDTGRWDDTQTWND